MNADAWRRIKKQEHLEHQKHISLTSHFCLKLAQRGNLEKTVTRTSSAGSKHLTFIPGECKLIGLSFGPVHTKNTYAYEQWYPSLGTASMRAHLVIKQQKEYTGTRVFKTRRAVTVQEG